FHSFAFSGFRQAPLRFPGGEGFAHLVVPSFFAISGFLIARSFLTTGSTARYLWQRALRIFPAYWVCLLLTAGVVAPLAYGIEHGSLAGFTDSVGPSALRYVVVNCYLKQRANIEGIWQGLPWPQTVNGSLWTLFYELKLYLLIAVLGSLGMLGRRRHFVAVAFVALWGL